MIGRSCALRRTAASCPRYGASIPRLFHSIPALRDNHYETLDIATTASHGEIKKQFYKLSKANHPDLHPNDPAKAKRFVQISEAYATLGSEEKKAKYDRDFMQTQQSGPSSSQAPHGSYSSATTGPGGRPASGLSRRRTQFRGPPPSFYRSGGWGDQSAKRSENAQKASHTHEARGESASVPAGPGMGPGGFATGMDNDVPHFDNRSHTKTHSDIERTRHRTRRKRAVRVEDVDLEGSGSSAIFNFLVLCSMLGVIGAVSAAVYGGKEASNKKQSNDS